MVWFTELFHQYILVNKCELFFVTAAKYQNILTLDFDINHCVIISTLTLQTQVGIKIGRQSDRNNTPFQTRRIRIAQILTIQWRHKKTRSATPFKTRHMITDPTTYLCCTDVTFRQQKTKTVHTLNHDCPNVIP